MNEDTKMVGREGMRQAKLLIGEQPNKIWLAEIRKLERLRLRLMVGWLTGHWRVNYHLSKFGLSRTMGCRWCHVEEETTEHLLSGCLAWADLLQKVFGSPHLEVEQMRKMDLGGLIFLAEEIKMRLAGRKG